ncbi:MAG TPA: DNA gyrase inhibitor YacG [Phycisphaerae bacterium]|nr:DNA gyrase inhibitor YacG [Phycisphaerae bacterium]
MSDENAHCSSTGLMRCPTCNKPLGNDGSEFFPFCSGQCRLIDLNQWLEGKFRVSRPLDPEEKTE